MAAQTPWKIEPVLRTDAPAMARNNMSAFWTDASWRLNWEDDITLDFLIEQLTKRAPQNLLKERDIQRHEKAVDPETGNFLGYARWELPSGHTKSADGQPAWPEAQQPDVGNEESKKIAELSNSAWWSPRDTPGMDDKNIAIKNRILRQKPYISLDYLAVHPENHRKGIATELVKSGMRAAEKLGLGVFVLAFSAGRPVYEKLGFQELDRNIEDAAKWGGKEPYAAYFMVWEPKEVDGTQANSA